MWDTDPLIENNDSILYTFNQAFNPLSDFDVQVDSRLDTSRERMQTHGMWPTFPYRGGMTITMQGSLLGSSATDYVTKRQAMVRALYGDNFSNLVSVSTMGTFRMKPSGEGELWEVKYITTSLDAPLQWQQGAYSMYMVTLWCPQPWFTGATVPSNKFRWA